MAQETEEAPEPVKNGKRQILRRWLMLGGIGLVLLVSAWFYILGGRYVDTDNAYIKTQKIMITPEVAGLIEKVMVADNQAVHAGDVMLVIDPSRYRIDLEKAEADLASAVRHIEEFKASFRQKAIAIDRARLEASYAETEYKRRAPLKQSVSESERAEFRQRRDIALKDLDILLAELEQIRAQLGGDDTVRTEDHPSYKAAQAALAEARLRLEWTEIKAPVDGIVNVAPRIGDFARENTPLFTMINTHEFWIEANFKETQLTHMKVGQPVSIEIDAYPDQELHGKVESISPGTGSEFSILPAQNATGNWVKIVQRVAVRVSISASDGIPLRTGMSGHVVVDTGSYPHLPWNGRAESRT